MPKTTTVRSCHPALADFDADDFDSLTDEALDALAIRVSRATDEVLADQDSYGGEALERAMQAERAIANEREQRSGRGRTSGHRIPEHTRALLRGGGVSSGRSSRRTADGRPRVLEDSTGNRLRVHYADDHSWSGDRRDDLPPEFAGFTAEDAFRAFCDDFAAVNRGERPRMHVLTSDTASVGIAPSIEPMILEYVFKRAVIGRIGAGMVAMTAPKHRILGVAASNESQVAFVAEGERIPQAANSLYALELQARKAGVLLVLSREMLEDASGVSDALVDHLSMSMASALDTALLAGDGVDGAVTGILSKSNIARTAAAAGLVFDEIVGLLYQFADNDYPREFSDLSLLWNPQLARQAETEKDAEGRYYGASTPDAFRAVRKISTNKVAVTETPDTTVTVLDGPSVIVGTRRGIRLEQTMSGSVTDETTGGNVSMWERDLVSWRLTWRGDVGVTRPQFVRQLTGVTL